MSAQPRLDARPEGCVLECFRALPVRKPDAAYTWPRRPPSLSKLRGFSRSCLTAASFSVSFPSGFIALEVIFVTSEESCQIVVLFFVFLAGELS
jgi:hypothetical protein